MLAMMEAMQHLQPQDIKNLMGNDLLWCSGDFPDAIRNVGRHLVRGSRLLGDDEMLEAGRSILNAA